jgi:hypothetical protein
MHGELSAISFQLAAKNKKLKAYSKLEGVLTGNWCFHLAISF